MIKKICLIIAVIMLISGVINMNFVYAVPPTFGEVVDEADDWVTYGETHGSGLVGTDKIAGIIRPIAQALTTIGVGILLIVAAIMALIFSRFQI